MRAAGGHAATGSGKAAAVLMLAMLPLAGCRFTTRKLPTPLAPEVVQTVAPQRLWTR